MVAKLTSTQRTCWVEQLFGESVCVMSTRFDEMRRVRGPICFRVQSPPFPTGGQGSPRRGVARADFKISNLVVNVKITPSRVV
jgi:hypothetical protein